MFPSWKGVLYLIVGSYTKFLAGFPSVHFFFMSFDSSCRGKYVAYNSLKYHVFLSPFFACKTLLVRLTCEIRGVFFVLCHFYWLWLQQCWRWKFWRLGSWVYYLLVSQSFPRLKCIDHLRLSYNSFLFLHESNCLVNILSLFPQFVPLGIQWASIDWSWRRVWVMQNILATAEAEISCEWQSIRCFFEVKCAKCHNFLFKRCQLLDWLLMFKATLDRQVWSDSCQIWAPATFLEVPVEPDFHYSFGMRADCSLRWWMVHLT